MIEIIVPPSGESVTSGTIGRWEFPNGAPVKKGDLVVSIETDKIAIEVNAEADGILEIITPEGEEVPIGAVIGRISSDTAAPAEAPSKAEPAQDAPKAEEKVSAPATPPAETVVVEKAPAAPVPAPAKKAPVAVDQSGRTTRTRMSPLRRKIATQLVNAQQTAALLTTFNECDMSAVMALRKQLQDSFVAKYGVKLGFMSFFLKAVVEALKHVPSINGRIDGDEVIQNHFYDVGVAVGTERGLVVPVIRDADQKSFAEIEQDILGYAKKARDGKLVLEDLTGGVFTISNGGVYGSLLSTPIINPPQSAILGMHSIQERPVAVNGQVVIRPMMYLALSYDHRLVDGKEAVTFLIRIKECIENPSRLLVGA